MQKETEASLTSMHQNSSRDIPPQSQQLRQDGRRHFVIFLASFLLKCDVTDVIL